MPLPAWEEGGRRTSTWGGTGIAITKYCKKQDLAWKFAKFLYLREEDLGKRFILLNIIPPLKDAWDMEELDTPNEFYSGQPLGRLYAELAPTTPPNYISPFWDMTNDKLAEAFVNSLNYYERNGDTGFEDYVRKELKRTADYVRTAMSRNRFLREGKEKAKGEI